MKSKVGVGLELKNSDNLGNRYISKLGGIHYTIRVFQIMIQFFKSHSEFDRQMFKHIFIRRFWFFKNSQFARRARRARRASAVNSGIGLIFSLLIFNSELHYGSVVSNLIFWIWNEISWLFEHQFCKVLLK